MALDELDTVKAPATRRPPRGTPTPADPATPKRGRGRPPGGAPLTPGLERLLTLTDVALWLGLTRQAVRRLTREAGLRYVRLGRTIKFRRAWVEDFLESRDGGARRRR
jgi:excisionase family DNA binding protein